MIDSGAGARASVGRIAEMAACLARLDGWRRWPVAFLSGAVATLALPPAYVLPALYLAFPVLVWLLGGVSRRRSAFALGWWFAFGYFAAGLYWIGNAMLVHASRHAWLLPFASLGLPAFLAMFGGFAALAGRGARSHLARGLRVALAWSALEWLRGHVLTGFPWNLVGHAWAGPDSLAQSASALGVYGVSLLAVLSACLPAALADPGRRRAAAALAAAGALLVVPWLGGAWRLAGAPAAGTDMQPGVGLRIVQAGIPQSEKWRRDLRTRNLGRHLELSVRDRPDWVTHVIWPENAATFFVEEDPKLRGLIARIVPPGGALLTGAPRRVRNPLRIWNSVFAVDAAGAVVGRYDKSHLVPFGEYVPFRAWLPMDKVAYGAIDYSPGLGPRTLHLPGLPPVSPLICYEAIFPGAVVDRRDRPQWLLNLTNDAWYGYTAGPHQHLTMARMRAIEEGLPLVRATSTGISAVIDSYGRILSRMELTGKGALDSRLPRPAARPTWYGRYGDGIYFMFMGMLLTAIVSVSRIQFLRRKRRLLPVYPNSRANED